MLQGVLMLLLAAGGGTLGYLIHDIRRRRNPEAPAIDGGRPDLVEALVAELRQRQSAFRFRDFTTRHAASPGDARRAAEAAYGKLCAKVVADGVVTDDEARKLARLAAVLEILPSRADELLGVAKASRFHDLATEVLADGIVTQRESEDLEALRDSLGLNEGQDEWLVGLARRERNALLTGRTSHISIGAFVGLLVAIPITFLAPPRKHAPAPQPQALAAIAPAAPPTKEAASTPPTDDPASQQAAPNDPPLKSKPSAVIAASPPIEVVTSEPNAPTAATADSTPKPIPEVESAIEVETKAGPEPIAGYRLNFTDGSDAVVKSYEPLGHTYVLIRENGYRNQRDKSAVQSVDRLTESEYESAKDAAGDAESRPVMGLSSGYRKKARTASRTTARLQSRMMAAQMFSSQFQSYSPGYTATGIPLHVGPRGGVYHITSGGNRSYHSR